MMQLEHNYSFALCHIIYIIISINNTDTTTINSYQRNLKVFAYRFLIVLYLRLSEPPFYTMLSSFQPILSSTSKYLFIAFKSLDYSCL